jgi:polyisoprenoid-binding protein YceI
LGLGRIDGSFAQFEGVLTIADAASGAASITARVRVDSAEMGREGYKEMMLGPGWFDAAQFPYSRFNGALAGWQGEGAGDFAGDLTIRDVTKAEVFDLRLSCDNVAECPGSAIGFSGELTIDRRAYGMTRLQGIVGADVTLRVSGTLDLRRDVAPPAIDAAPASPAAEAAPSP